MKIPKVVVLGAGAAGLSAAWRLAENGVDVTVIEKEPYVGGLGATISLNGNKFDFGTHHFHTDDAKLLEKIQRVTNGELTANDRNIQIKFKGKYFRYPLRISDIIFGLKWNETALAVLSMAASIIKTKLSRKPLQTAEDVIIAKYGKRLYDTFFKNYTTKFWGVSPDRISGLFATQRISQLDAFDMIKKIVDMIKKRNSPNPDQFIELVAGKLYYHKNGIGEIFNRISDEIKMLGGKIYLSAKISDVAVDKNGIRITYNKDGTDETISCDYLISSVPFKELMDVLSPKPQEIVLRASGNLKYRSLVVVGLVISRERILNALFVYFRDKIFNRLAEPKNAGLEVKPSGATVLLSEMSCDEGDDCWNAANLHDTVINELEEEGLCKRQEVKDSIILKAKYAYPMYSIGFEKDLREVKGYLESFGNIFSIGRQGSFQHINMHVAMQMGLDTAEKIIKKA